MNSITNRPTSATVGIALLYVPIFAAFLMLALNTLGMGNKKEPLNLGAAAFLGAWLTFLALLVYKAGRGRNWARLAVLAVTALTILSLPEAISKLRESYHPLYLLTTGTSIFCDPAGTIALFLPASNAWYRACRKAAA